MNLTALGRQIKKAREINHMTQEQLSAAVDYIAVLAEQTKGEI